jgi:hypothetical protein
MLLRLLRLLFWADFRPRKTLLKTLVLLLKKCVRDQERADRGGRVTRACGNRLINLGVERCGGVRFGRGESGLGNQACHLISSRDRKPLS